MLVYSSHRKDLISQTNSAQLGGTKCILVLGTIRYEVPTDTASLQKFLCQDNIS